jgi:hypothetical protein
MSEPDPPSEQADDDPAVLVVIIRSGGFAGIRRRWHVEPPRDEAPRWIELIERCPWGEPDPAQQHQIQRDQTQPGQTQADQTQPGQTPPAQSQRGADRYVWSIQARTPAARRERDVADSALDGPWRELVDAVRASARS